MSDTALPPRILSIAGSDSSGGAGIQADIKTITMMGGYAMTAITAITAQNSLGVTRVDTLSPNMVAAQIEACVCDIGVDAVKIGMLGSAEIAHLVADRLEALAVPVVFDPVMVATSGAVLADAGTVAAFARLARIAAVTTPNVPELKALSGHAVTDERSLREAVHAFLCSTGSSAVLAKGGHMAASPAVPVCDRLYVREPLDGRTEWTFEHPRLDTRHSHGTGCTLASAVAVGLAGGGSLPESVAAAGDFVHAALRAAPGFGAGHGPMGHQAVR